MVYPARGGGFGCKANYEEMFRKAFIQFRAAQKDDQEHYA